MMQCSLLCQHSTGKYLLQVLVALLPVQLPANCTGKATENGPSASAPAIYVGDLVEFLTPGVCQAIFGHYR